MTPFDPSTRRSAHGLLPSIVRGVGAATLAVATALATPEAAVASDHAPAKEHGGGGGEAAGGHEEPPAPARTDVLNLDKFRIRGCRTTDKEVIDLQFGIWLVLSTKTTEAGFHELESWKHRLRDQVIIAARGAAPADFADPELRRLQRMILFRVKRLPIGPHVIGVYLTDFSLDEGETLADVMQPAIIPSAAPVKKKSGGH